VAMMFAACSSDDGIGGNPNNEVKAAQAAIKSKLFDLMTLEETANTISEKVTYNWTDEVDILNILKEGTIPDSKAVYSNYIYYSTGKPFKVVMLYANGLFSHHVGVYWYDEAGNKYEQLLWQEEDETSETWRNPYHDNDKDNTKGVISRLKDETGAYEINLPKNTKFGFYQVSYYKNQVESETTTVTNESTCTNCKGTGQTGTGFRKRTCNTCNGTGKITNSVAGESFDYKFYSEASLNPKGTCQTVTFNAVDADWTIVGFEDISTVSSKWTCDKDFNDIVFGVNPQLCIEKLPIDDNDPVFDEDSTTEIINPDTVIITPDQPIVYPNQGSVETNLSVTEKDGSEVVRLSLHIRDTTDVTIVLPYVDEAIKDDFAIVAKHDIEYAYSQELVIGENTVKLIYGLTEEGYLTITTEGVNADVLDYCRNTYADGLTFECNLVLPVGATMQGNPTITFTKEPYVYITSSVNNSAEATDYEVVWEDGGGQVYQIPEYVGSNGLTYKRTYYSKLDWEVLKTYDWFKFEEATRDQQ